MNCKREVEQDQMKIFAEVLVCPECFTIADRLYDRGNRELRMMLTVLKEIIRLALIKGELQFSQPQSDEVRSEDLMKKFAALAKEVKSRSK